MAGHQTGPPAEATLPQSQQDQISSLLKQQISSAIVKHQHEHQTQRWEWFVETARTKEAIKGRCVNTPIMGIIRKEKKIRGDFPFY